MRRLIIQEKQVLICWRHILENQKAHSLAIQPRLKRRDSKSRVKEGTGGPLLYIDLKTGHRTLMKSNSTHFALY